MKKHKVPNRRFIKDDTDENFLLHISGGEQYEKEMGQYVINDSHGGFFMRRQRNGRGEPVRIGNGI